MTKECRHGHTYDPETDPPGFKGKCPECQRGSSARYRKTERGRQNKNERMRVYRATEKGKTTGKRHKQKRVRVVGVHFGYTETPEQAQAIVGQAHVKIADFQNKQKKERKNFDKALDKSVAQVLTSRS